MLMLRCRPLMGGQFNQRSTLTSAVRRSNNNNRTSSQSQQNAGCVDSTPWIQQSRSQSQSQSRPRRHHFSTGYHDRVGVRPLTAHAGGSGGGSGSNQEHGVSTKRALSASPKSTSSTSTSTPSSSNEKASNHHQRNLSSVSAATAAATPEEVAADGGGGKTTDAPSTSAAAYMELAKARLSALVVSTTAVGYVSAGGLPVTAEEWAVMASCVVGTSLCSCSAAAFNQIIEADRDRRMKRTRQRPLVRGTISVNSAVAAASLWGASGVTLLAAGTDPVTAALGAGNILLYAGLYTHMKPISIYNTWVGAVVGAVPPVMGWTAATAAATAAAGGSSFAGVESFLAMEPLLLGGTLYLWQMPHFFALSYMHRVDYKRGGFEMLPCVEPDGERTADVIVRYAWYLSAVPFVSTACGVTGTMFAVEGIALNAYALHVAHKFRRDRTNANARKIFLTSLWYLPCLLTLFLLHSKIWDEDQQDESKDGSDNFLANRIRSIRDIGRDMCLHETVVVASKNREKKNDYDDDECNDRGDKDSPDASSSIAASSCPIVMGNETTRKGIDAATEAVISAKATAAAAAAATAATPVLLVRDDGEEEQDVGNDRADS